MGRAGAGGGSGHSGGGHSSGRSGGGHRVSSGSSGRRAGCGGSSRSSFIDFSVLVMLSNQPILSIMQLLSYPTSDSSRSLFCVLFGTLFVEDEFDDGKLPNTKAKIAMNMISDIMALRPPPLLTITVLRLGGRG